MQTRLRNRRANATTSSSSSSSDGDDDDGTFLTFGASKEANDDESEQSIVSSTLLARVAPAEAPPQRAAPSRVPSPPSPPARSVFPVAAANVAATRVVNRKRARDFAEGDPLRVEREARPPWAPPLGDAEARELVEWQRREVRDERQLRTLPWYRFAMLVAGRSSTPLNQLVRLRSAGRAAPQAPEQRRAADPVDPLALVDESDDEEEEELERRPRFGAPTTPSTPAGRRVRRNVFAQASLNVNLELDERPGLPSDGYLGAARITGVAFLSPTLLSAIEAALDDLVLRYPRVFAPLADEAPLIASPSTISLFADLTSAEVVLARYRRSGDPKAVSTIVVFEREREHALRRFAFVRRLANGAFVLDAQARERELERRRRSIPEAYDVWRPIGEPPLAPGPRTSIRSPDDYRIRLAPSISGAALVNALLDDREHFRPLEGVEARASPYGGRGVYM